MSSAKFNEELSNSAKKKQINENISDLGSVSVDLAFDNDNVAEAEKNK